MIIALVGFLFLGGYALTSLAFVSLITNSVEHGKG